MAGLARTAVRYGRCAGAAGGAKRFGVDDSPCRAVAGDAVLFAVPVALAAGGGAGLCATPNRSGGDCCRADIDFAAGPVVVCAGGNAGAPWLGALSTQDCYGSSYVFDRDGNGDRRVG